MNRVAAAAFVGLTVALFAASGQAAAEPPSAAGYAIGKCYDGAQPPEQRPTRFAYNCDETGVMQDMTWSSWDSDGAQGTGTDNSIECKPNCAQGPRLLNPIVVHAWNPMTPTAPGCPPGVKFYSDLTIAYPEGVPPWIDPGTTWDEGTDFVTIDDMPGVHFSGLAPTCSPTSAL